MDQESEPPIVSRNDFDHLCKAANDNVPGALDHLRQLLDSQPAIWQRVGDMALLAELKLIELIAGGNKLLAESVQRKLAALRADLIRPGAPGAERLGVERVVATWLQLQNAQTQLIGSTAGTAVSKDWLRRLTQVDRSHAAALRALVNLQRLTPLPASPRLASAAPQGCVQNDSPSAGPTSDVIPIGRVAAGEATTPAPELGIVTQLRSTGS